MAIYDFLSYVIFIKIVSNVGATNFHVTNSSHYNSNNGMENIEAHEARRNGLMVFCELLNVPNVNCTCLDFPDFCDFADLFEKADVANTSTVYHCDTTYNAIRAGFNTLGASLGIIGNGIVLVVTIMNWEEGTRYNQVIVGLAITDFIFSCNQLIVSIPQFWTCKWLYSDISCKLLTAAVDMSVSLAMGFILIIALERYVGILYPFSNRFTTAKFWIIISLNILIGILSVVPLIAFLDVNHSGICREYWPNKNYSIIYSWTMLICYFILPVAAIVVMYYRIIRKLHTTRLMFGKRDSALGEHSTRRRIKNNRRIMVILISVLLMFIVLVLPNKLVWILMDYIKHRNLTIKTYRILYLVGLIPYSFHVCVNPIVYSFVDSKFRTKVVHLCCWKRLQKVAGFSSGRPRTETKLSTTLKLKGVSDKCDTDKNQVGTFC